MVNVDAQVQNIPFPFDHFFFCFLPPDDAAGAWYRQLRVLRDISTGLGNKHTIFAMLS